MRVAIDFWGRIRVAVLKRLRSIALCTENVQIFCLKNREEYFFEFFQNNFRHEYLYRLIRCRKTIFNQTNINVEFIHKHTNEQVLRRFKTIHFVFLSRASKLDDA